MPTYGKCSLCGESKDLRLGHLIPQSVVKWQKESSATGFIRSSPVVNRRSQDGLKEHILCGDCELLFNRGETPVANKIFHPLNRRDAHIFHYQSWLLKFAVSISWRVLSWYRSIDATEYSQDAKVLMTEALKTWKSFLFDRLDDPAPFHQHMIFHDAINPIPTLMLQTDGLFSSITVLPVGMADCSRTVKFRGNSLKESFASEKLAIGGLLLSE